MSEQLGIVITRDELLYLGDPRVNAGYAALAQAGFAVLLDSDEALVAEEVEAQYGADPRVNAALMREIRR